MIIALAILEFFLAAPFAIHGFELKMIMQIQALDNFYFGWGTIFPSFSSSQLTTLLQFCINLIGVIVVLWAVGRLFNQQVYLARLDSISRSIIGILLLFTYYFDRNELISPFVMFLGWYLVATASIEFQLSRYRRKTRSRW